MTPLEIFFHVAELIATFTVGAWAGSSRCHIALEVNTDEDRRYSWLDRIFPCRPASRPASGSSSKSLP